MLQQTGTSTTWHITKVAIPELVVSESREIPHCLVLPQMLKGRKRRILEVCVLSFLLHHPLPLVKSEETIPFHLKPILFASLTVLTQVQLLTKLFW